jgi:hypothetical protein
MNTCALHRERLRHAGLRGRRLGIERHLLVQRAHDQMQPLQRIGDARDRTMREVA